MALNVKFRQERVGIPLLLLLETGLQLSTGRIIFVINVRENQQTGITTFKNYALYSDDGGKTWSVSKNGPQNNLGGNESKIVELVDGRLLMSTRPNSGNKRMHAYSSDGGETWTKAEPKSDITVASSNGDMIYYTSTKNGWDKNRIIHFIPTSTITVSGEGQYNGQKKVRQSLISIIALTMDKHLLKVKLLEMDNKLVSLH